MTPEQAEAMKRAFDTLLLAEHEAGYVIVRAPLPIPDGRCHSCGELEGTFDFTPMFERDAATKESFMHIAVVCADCKASPERIEKLGDSIVAHGKQLREEYGDAVVVKRAPVPSA